MRFFLVKFLRRVLLLKLMKIRFHIGDLDHHSGEYMETFNISICKTQ